MTRKQRRLVMVGFCALGLTIAGVLSAVAFKDTLVFFYSPSDLATNHVAEGATFRLGGMVAKDSVVHSGDTVTFTITDFRVVQPVTYTGLLPDLFREGQGAVAEGRLEADGMFHATTILAKHDERYMPPEVAKALGQPGAQHHETDTLVNR